MCISGLTFFWKLWGQSFRGTNKRDQGYAGFHYNGPSAPTRWGSRDVALKLRNSLLPSKDVTYGEPENYPVKLYARWGRLRPRTSLRRPACYPHVPHASVNQRNGVPLQCWHCLKLTIFVSLCVVLTYSIAPSPVILINAHWLTSSFCVLLSLSRWLRWLSCILEFRFRRS